MKSPQEMGGMAINKEYAALSKESSALTDKLIAAGRGNERASETRLKSDPLAVEFKRIQDRLFALRIEAKSRYGPDWRPGYALPGPRKVL